nr:hypothetical protein KPHV_45830 [Kitasatospora purpeofusca]
MGYLVVAEVHGVGHREAVAGPFRLRGVDGHGIHRSLSGGPPGVAGSSFTQNEAGTGTGMRDALDVYDPTPTAGGPGRPERIGTAGADRSGVPWRTTEDIPHTGISVDVALGHDGSLVDRTGGLR